MKTLRILWLRIDIWHLKILHRDQIAQASRYLWNDRAYSDFCRANAAEFSLLISAQVRKLERLTGDKS